jgi:hypothetical protein
MGVREARLNPKAPAASPEPAVTPSPVRPRARVVALAREVDEG